MRTKTRPLGGVFGRLYNLLKLVGLQTAFLLFVKLSASSYSDVVMNEKIYKWGGLFVCLLIY